MLLGNGILARMENVLTDEIIARSASSSLSVHEIWGHGGTHATLGTKMPPIENVAFQAMEMQRFLSQTLDLTI